MKRLIIFIVLLIFPVIISAQNKQNKKEENISPKDVILGTIHVKTNSEYAKPYINGVAWEGHEFENDGKTILIYKIDRTKKNVIKLEPIMNPLLGSKEFTISPKQWRLKRVKAGVKEWRIDRTIRFKKSKPTKKPKPLKRYKKKK